MKTIKSDDEGASISLSMRELYIMMQCLDHVVDYASDADINAIMNCEREDVEAMRNFLLTILRERA